MPTHTTLKGFEHFGDSLLLEQLEYNLISYFDWGLLCKGAFFNIEIPTTGAYGGNAHVLRYVNDDRWGSMGRVWEGYRQNWIWESGVEYDYQPISISGVNVNGTFYPTGTSGAFAHSINYPNGQVIFDSAISTSSTVSLEYSHKWVNFYPSNTPWFRDIMFESFRVDHSTFSNPGSGLWVALADNRVQLPAVIVEPIPQISMKPLQLGDTSHERRQGVLFHILAEDTSMRNKLVDTIVYQNDKTIYLYDRNRLEREGGYPLNYKGDKVDNPLTYPDLVRPSGEGGYFWRKAKFVDFKAEAMDTDGRLFSAIVAGTIGVDMYDAY